MSTHDAEEIALSALAEPSNRKIEMEEKKRKTSAEQKKAYDKARSRTRVNI